MCPLRRVEDHRAGPSALGILVPPGKRTFLIVRPRSLAWDLLLLRPDAVDAFRELHHHEADAVAREVYQALTNGPGGRVEEVDCPDGPGFRVRVRLGRFALLACARQPGQPYQPLTLPDAERAYAAAEQLRSLLHPPPDKEQEVYLNTHHFTR